MALPAFATVEELAVRMPGGVAEADEPRAQAALDDASALIRFVAGTSWVDDDEIAFGDIADYLQDAIVAVCIAVAKRVMENPQGATSMSLGDSSISLANSSSDAYLTANERRIIRRAAGGAIGSVDLEIGTPGWSGDVLAVYGQTEPMPFTYEPLRP